MSNEFVGILTTKSMLETSVGEDKQAITRIIPVPVNSRGGTLKAKT